MFDNLTDKLSRIFTQLRGRGRLTEADVAEALREVRLALLEADVNFKVVKDFVGRVRERAVGQEVLESLTPAQMVVKILHEELIGLLGEGAPIRFAPNPPSVIMLCGLQGSGKTTTAGKLALWCRRQGRNPLLVACDVYRPAAVRQLQVLGQQLGIPVYIAPDGVAPPAIAQEAVGVAKRSGCDVVVLDTAGRLHINDEMMAELEQVKAAVHPEETLLVVDAMTGQDAVNFAQEFQNRVAVDGFIMTKLDGDARGGAALSIRAVTGVPIKFIGVGEKMDALDVFHPDRMASRILGMGDVLSLIEKAEQALDQKKAAELERRLRENRFDLNDFLEQLQQMRRMGPMEQVLSMLPGMNRLKGVQVDERQLARHEAMVRAMTPEERSDPSILNGSRKRRIALGSGVTVQEVNQFLRQFELMRQIVHQITGGGGKRPRRKLRLPF
ncbi:MAG: signal recognition particle protein [Chthonomonadales bacterium]